MVQSGQAAALAPTMPLVFGPMAHAGYRPETFRMCGWSWQRSQGNWRRQKCLSRGFSSIFPFPLGAMQLLSASLVRALGSSRPRNIQSQIETRIGVDARKTMKVSTFDFRNAMTEAYIDPTNAMAYKPKPSTFGLVSAPMSAKSSTARALHAAVANAICTTTTAPGRNGVAPEPFTASLLRNNSDDEHKQ